LSLDWAYPYSVGPVLVTWDSLCYLGQPWALVTWAVLGHSSPSPPRSHFYEVEIGLGFFDLAIG